MARTGSYWPAERNGGESKGWQRNGAAGKWTVSEAIGRDATGAEGPE